MTLERGLTDGALAWSINAESDDRTGIVFRAQADGSGLADPADFAQGASDVPPEQPAPSGAASNVDEALSTAECLQNANGDIAKLQVCAS